MLSKQALKAWVHKDLPQRDKLLLILASYNVPCSIEDVKDRGLEVGLKITSSWNPSSTLSKSKGLAIHLPAGWEITDAGLTHLRAMGVTNIAPAAVQVAHELRSELQKIVDTDTRGFVEEAIRCYEHELYRSAVVMSWLAAIHVLYRYIAQNHLDDFNAAAPTYEPKWKVAKNTDDLGRMNEGKFLICAGAISAIGKNVKEELEACLKRRNGCGHPNSMKIGPNAVAHHLETLLLNVFRKFK